MPGYEGQPAEGNGQKEEEACLKRPMLSLGVR